tara:strand:+ start:15842 stop:17032 length:1191 start_codon:yes stop_codon:yes gene_type:complete
VPRPTVPYKPEVLACAADAYCPTHNPDGKINLAVTTGDLLAPLWHDRLPTASVRELVAHDPCLYNYSAHRGRTDLRAEVARFLCEAFGDAVPPTVDGSQVALFPGSTAAYDVLAHCLLDAGDVIVTTRPRYAAYDFDFGARAGVSVVHVDDYDPRTLDAACDARVRAVLVCSPHNPLGTALDADALEALSRWCARTGRHLICSEVYAASLWAEGAARHASSLALISRGDHVHTVWSLSKDLGLTGMRVGALVSSNATLHARLDSLCALCAVSQMAQVVVRDILRDRSCVTAVLAGHKTALRDAFAAVRVLLDAHAIPYTPPVGGSFVYLDLRRWLRGRSEEELWRALFEETGVLLTPGSAQYDAEGGHFRLCFSVSTLALRAALARLDAFFLRRAS